MILGAKPLHGIHVEWLVQGVNRSSGGELTSMLASNRYRVLMPATALQQTGDVNITWSSVEAGQTSSRAPIADVLVIGKMLVGNDAFSFRNLAEGILRYAEDYRRRCRGVVIDVNDDHFNHPVMGDYWRRLVRLASIVVVGSDEMAHRVRHEGATVLEVIGDPVGVPREDVKVFTPVKSRLFRIGSSRSNLLQLAWYGNPVNWPDLVRWAEELVPLSERQPWVIWAVTRIDDGMRAYTNAFNRHHGTFARLDLTDWTQEDQVAVMRDAHVILVPSDTGNPTKRVKTANRVTDALNMGRPVLASPLPSYQPFAEAIWLAEHPLSLLTEMLAAPDAMRRKALLGQKMVDACCSNHVIGQRWMNVLAQAHQKPDASGAYSESQSIRQNGDVAPVSTSVASDPLRLNLGCGDKILPGYVNVDVVASRAGKRPDVLCDLHDLAPFVSNSVDEVMAIHVVEHFWRWEVEAVLIEWIRVLKPGGSLILECPNLISACEAFLKDPEGRSGEDQSGQQTMWVFYGDPQWKDPYMVHRWGYTPASLSKLMRRVGLVDVRQEPAQYKLREPRDMRVVGQKPLLN